MTEWYGWLRRDRRHKWQRVCGPCSSLAECSRQLGIEASREGIPDRKISPSAKDGHKTTDADV